jgi:hypothetical protein
MAEIFKKMVAQSQGGSGCGENEHVDKCINCPALALCAAFRRIRTSNLVTSVSMQFNKMCSICRTIKAVFLLFDMHIPSYTIGISMLAYENLLPVCNVTQGTMAAPAARLA